MRIIDKVDHISRQLAGKQLRTRFAPGVTGRLHLGHVANAIYTWGISRALSGEVVFRLEDHARNRWLQEYEDKILEDMERLGFEPDYGLLEEFRTAKRSDFRQSDCYKHYSSALDHLRTNYNVYACDCMDQNPQRTWQGPYNGRCRRRRLKWKKGRRLRVEIPDDPIVFYDSFQGWQTQRPGDFKGDPEIINPVGDWTYMFCVVVDDNRHGINTIVRGKGLWAATSGQIMLFRMLGHTPPVVWIHHDEIMDPATSEKLSKRRGAQPIGEQLDLGISAETIIGRAAAQVGLTTTDRLIKAKQLASLFS